MERRFVSFLVLSFAILMGYSALMNKLHPRPPQKPQEQQAAAPANGEQAPEKKGNDAADAAPAEADGKPREQPQTQAPVADQAKPTVPGGDVEPAAEAPAAIAAAEPETPQQWLTLGSADKKDPYRMLVTLTNQGAAIARIDLNSPRYCDIDDRSGYLGDIIMDDDLHRDGCPVHVVGPGTPAAEAGLKPGDMLTAVNGKPVLNAQSLRAILKKTRPDHKTTLSFVRDGQPQTATATLRRRPLELISPEDRDQLSMLLTLQQFDNQKLEKPAADKEKEKDKNNDPNDAPDLAAELQGVNLRTANWEIVAATQDEVRFRRALSDKGLEVFKTYRLAKVPQESEKNVDYPAYHLEFEIEIRNIGGAAHKVAYRLDGPNGLPKEGDWYASKVGRSSGAGLRDCVVSFGLEPGMVGALDIANSQKPVEPWHAEQPGNLLKYIGVDAQYFSAVLIPQRPDANDLWFEECQATRVGKVNPNHPNWTNTSCRLTSVLGELKPDESLKHKFQFFTGPKRPTLVQQYGLSDLVYYGWPIFAWFAVPMTAILHAFYGVVCNYGLAIVMLTIVVRGCMFPISRKQAYASIKMQELQPEMKRIQEKYKKDTEGRVKALQDLYRKHHFSPYGGCLTAFIQIPVFLGLWRSLMVDVELRDSPLLTHSIRWCSNLAAPDMLFNWSSFMPSWIVNGPGILWLGPYFNLLPILALLMILWQQKKMMPPPADEQAAMQQKVMKYVMIFTGVLFFKVAAGTCIYLITSTLWGLGERQFLPKHKPVDGDNATETRAEAKAKARLEKIAEAARTKKKKKSSLFSSLFGWVPYRAS